MKNIKLLLVIVIIKQSAAQDIRSLILSQVNSIKYQCNNPGCSPSTIAPVSSLRDCEVACLFNPQCRTVTFDQSNNQCRLFPDIPSQYGDLISEPNVVTMIAIDNRQLSARAGGYLRWNTTGITILNSSKLASASGLHFDLNDNLYIADEINSVVWKLSNNLVNLTIVAGTDHSAGSNSNQLNYPNGVYVDKKGNIYISEYTNNRIQKYISGSTSGITIAGITGSPGSSLNQFSAPRYFALDSTETYIYIADSANNRIMRYLSNSTSGNNGVVMAGGTGAGNTNTNLNEPWGIYYLPSVSTDLYIANANGHSVIRWTPGASSGVFVAGIPGTSGTASTLLNRPAAVRIDSYQNLYVTDCNNHRIQLFCYNNQTGITIAGTGTAGISRTQLNVPRTFVFDSAMNLYVGDYGNARIQKFMKL
ncbi:hypothetical protein I4U23_016059 [Adineta vaga]|nr:hypothetical protein I4U23_016059 [Adineta vaga]